MKRTNSRRMRSLSIAALLITAAATTCTATASHLSAHHRSLATTYLYSSYNNPDCSGGLSFNTTVSGLDQCTLLPLATAVTLSSIKGTPTPNSNGKLLCAEAAGFITNNNDCTPDAGVEGEVTLLPAPCGVCQSDGYREWLFTCNNTTSVIAQFGVPSMGTGSCSAVGTYGAVCNNCTTVPLLTGQCLSTPEFSGPIGSAAMMVKSVNVCTEGRTKNNQNDENNNSDDDDDDGVDEVLTLALSQSLSSISPCDTKNGNGNLLTIVSAPLGQCVNGMKITIKKQ